MNFTEVIHARRSVRKFKEQPVPDSVIRVMLETAVCAPSASNRQPWRFMVVSEPALRSQLAASTREAVARLSEEVIPEFKSDFLGYCQHFLYFEHAPVLIFALSKSETTLAALLKKGSLAREWMQSLEMKGAIISVAMAVQNLLLSAADQGLSTCVMTGPLVAVDAFSRILSVPEGWDILCMVCVGYPDEEAQPIRKKPVDHILIHPKTGQTYGL